MTKAQEQFIQLLKQVVFDGVPPSGEYSGELVRLACQQDLACFLGKTLNGQRNRYYYAAAYRDTARSLCLRQLSELLEEAGVDYVLLKGAWIKDLYPNPALRTSSDIDVLVRPEAVDETAERICEKLGFRASAKGFHCIPLYGNSVCVELHYRLDNGNPKMDSLLGQAWEYAVREGGHRYVFTPEFTVFYSLCHTANHFQSGGCGVRPFLDLQLMLDRLSPEEAGLRVLLRAAELERFYEVMLCLCGRWFDRPDNERRCRERPDAAVPERVADYVLTNGLMGTPESTVTYRRSEQYAHTVTSGVKAGTRLGRLAYLKKRLFSSREYLESLYPSLRGKTAAAVPFYHLKRWTRLLNRSTGRRIRNEVTINRRLTVVQIENTESLMRALQL